jgi:signal transduction histidine kinase
MASDRSLLRTLEQILALDATDLRSSMEQVSNLVARAIPAQKVDVFLVQDGRTLVALGTSDTPLGARQRELGLDRMPLSNGGRAAEVYRTGERYLGDSARDPKERPDLVTELGLRSTLMVPLEVDGARRGVLGITSREVGAFDQEHAVFAAALARWIGAVIHRIELVEVLAGTAREDGRRAGAEELVTLVAHDFRNFLAPIAGRVALLQRRAVREGREPDRRDCEAAQRSIRGVTRLVEDLLDVARVEQGLLDLVKAPVDLVALAREVAAGLALPDREIVVEAPPELVVLGDAARLRQIVENLLSNAVKYAPPHTAVRVTLSADGSDGDRRARLRVADRGQGIPADVLPFIFERFGRERASKGLGLGLFVAHELAVAHGGALAVESSPGRGSTFTLALPMAAD